MIPEEKLLSQIASRNDGYYTLMNGIITAIQLIDIPIIGIDAEIFHTYGGKVFDVETGDEIYNVFDGILI